MVDWENNGDLILGRLLQRLELARSKALSVLEQTGRRGLARLGTDENFEELAIQLYRVIASELHQLLCEEWRISGETNDDQKSNSNEDCFFFWPGYLRYATKNPGRLDVLRRKNELELGSFDGSRILEFIESDARDGVGYVVQKENFSEFTQLPLRVWMYLLYGRQLDQFVLHGFTHWATAHGEAFTTNQDENGFIQRYPLVAVEFQWGSSNPTSISDGILHVSLPSNGSISSLKNSIHSALNDSELIDFGPRGPQVNHFFPPYIFRRSKSGTEHGVDEFDDKLSEIAMNLMTIIIGSMFIDCSSWRSAEQSEKAAQFLEFIEHTKERCLSLELNELSHALTLGVESIKNLGGSSCHHIFSFYYAIPLPPGITIEGFHKIDGNLGSINLYTNYRIPRYVLQILRVWLHRIYEDLRLLEVASDSEQRGMRTAASAFQHEIKHLANAVGSQWVVPINNLLNVGTESGAPDIENDSFVGTIQFRKEYKWLAQQAGIAPFQDVLESMVTLLRFWTFSDSVADIPFQVGEKMQVAGFVLKCMQVAQRAVEPYALSNFSAESLHQLEIFRKSREALLRLRRLQLRALKPEIDRMVLINSDSENSIWVARLLIGILKNAIQHGSPIEPIRLVIRTVKGRRRELTVINRKFDYKEVLQGLEKGKLGVETAQSAEELAIALNAVDQGASELESAGRGFSQLEESEGTSFKSGDVIDACLVRLNGESKFRDFQLDDENYYECTCEFEF